MFFQKGKLNIYEHYFSELSEIKSLATKLQNVFKL